MNRSVLSASAIGFLVLAPMSLAAADGQEPVDYAPAIAKLNAAVQHEVEHKQLPAFSISIVDDQRVIWADGFGYQDADQKIPATAQTVYRVGSVSKLFTDIAVMQLVERGELVLDAAVQSYLPDFKPTNPYGTPITLRQLMTHRSGLVRESPVGKQDSVGSKLF